MSAQLITTITNTGTTVLEVIQFDSVWTIYDSNGLVIATGGYVEAIGPRLLAPGETGYVAASEFTGDYKKSDFDHAEIDVYFDESNGSAYALTTENTRTRRNSSGDIEVTGEIRNDGTERVDSAEVLAVFLAADGTPLGFADGLFDNVEAGQTRAFQISTTFADIAFSDIADTKIFASDDSF
ncbi:MAG: FxLYD domain-containing protein [Candidatus Limnocylindrales bacterium]